MRSIPVLAATLLLAATALTPAVALAAQPTTAADFNLFVLGNQLTHGSDVEGSVAIAGTSHFDSFSIGAVLPPSSNNDYNFVVGGALDLGDGGITGKTISGGAYTGPGYHNVAANTPAANLPVNFAAEDTRVHTLSDYFASLPTTVQADPFNPALDVQNAGHRLVFNAQATGLNVINLGSGLLAGVNELKINLAAGSQVVFNVTGLAGDTYDFSGGMYLNGSQLSNGHHAGAENVLWNFNTASLVTMHGIGFIGSVLAPDADFQGEGVIDGQVVVDGFHQYRGNTIQINWTGAPNTLLALTPPTTPTVPEPASWTLMLTGFGLMGAALRRRRIVAAG